MKRLLMVTCVLALAMSLAFGGTESYSGKDVKQTVQQQEPCPEWYRDQEWNVSLWGTYAFTGEHWADDTYLGVDHAWGGGIDAKYFFHRYFGVGIEGYGLALSDRTGFVFDTDDSGSTRGDRGAAGAALGTLTLRYPIPCTRFAPYLFGGGGAIFGGGGRGVVFFNDNGDVVGTRGDDTETKILGQVGGGFEVRFTPHVGWMSDFSWNIVDGPTNNFGMARTGITFAF